VAVWQMTFQLVTAQLDLIQFAPPN